MTICQKTEQFVCISCVDEVRYSFVSHLSEALRRKGIKDVVIDVDSDDLLSKDSQAKLEKARVSVMVLPGNCDPSKVWLDKFVKVLECPRNKDQVVVPVLYGDSPLQGEWLSALNLGGLSPIHQSRKECSDAKLVEEIVRDVYEKLFHMGRIGIYSKLLEIENMVCKQPVDDIRCVGIWGMPGIGKTTLAKALFDQISGEFDAYCFIKDYDKVIHENGLYRLLEEQFLKEKPGASGDITKFSLLKNKLYNKRVLVVLDDVRNPLVAEPFLGGFDWFGPESLIIITSRDKQVLRLCEVNQIYEVQGLNEKEARQLFSSCAINYMEEQNLEELSTKVIKYANGHPLALKIYGRELKCKRKLSEMETAFLKLKQRPPFRIVDAFKSSYDTLSDSEKNIFLDIACFFQGEMVDYVMQLLEGCGFFPRVGIDVLVEKHLVTMSDNCVRMHNLIQDVGREIINGETVQIERRSRLWEPWSVKYLLEDNGEKENGEPKTTFKRSQGTKEIEGMFLDTSNLSFDVKPTAFENMLNLRLLKIYCSNPKNHPVINFPKGSLHSLPNELRLLHWENYSLQSLPQSFDPSHLVEINMPYSQLQKLWDGTENLEMLRTIRLCHSQQLVDIGDLLKAQNLEVIDLQGCTRLQSFPATGKLLHLRVVNLSGCTEVKSFPEIPPNIETLHLQGTGIEKLLIPKPNGGELVSLSELKGLPDALKLERLTSLEKSSLSSQVLGKLICLNLKDCSRLQSLPNMVNLKLLKVLDISGCSELKTIKGFPPNLKQLYIAGTAVRKVPQLPQSLQLLSAHGCVSLKSIHFDFEKLPVHYTFSNCFDLSPQMANVFLVKALSNAEHIPRERQQQELKESPAFSFCAPSHAKNISTLDLKPGSSVMTRLIPSWRNMPVGFAMLVEVAFSEDYCDATGFGIRCVCKWKNKEGHSHRIERNLHCWALGKAVQKDHMFVFFDVNMHPSTDEGNGPNIWADLVVFEFFPVSKQAKPLDNCCTVTRCGVRVITAANCITSLENVSPVLSLDPMDISGYENVEVLRDNYDDLQELEKVLFLYIACLFNDEDVDFVAPLIAGIDMDVSSGLKVLASRSLISVSSNGEIMMHFLLRQMGKEFLRTKLMLPGSSEKSESLVESSQSSTITQSTNSGNWINNLSDIPKKFNSGKSTHQQNLQHSQMMMMMMDSHHQNNNNHQHHNHHQFQIGSSKYLSPAQELLGEFCSLRVKESDEYVMMMKQRGKQKEEWDTSHNNNDQPLHSLEFMELQKRKAKLLSMLEELKRRYGHHREQLSVVAASFEAAVGVGAAEVYTGLVSRAMSRHFRCLKDGLVGQIQATSQALGEREEDNSAVSIAARGQTPRLMPSTPLRAWFFEHFIHPYPSDDDKHILAQQTGLSISQVSNWFINARVKLWKPMIEEMYCEETKEEQMEITNPMMIDAKLDPNQIICMEPESLSSIVTNPTSKRTKKINCSFTPKC